MQPNELLEPSPGRDGFLVPPWVRVENEFRALNGLGTFFPEGLQAEHDWDINTQGFARGDAIVTGAQPWAGSGGP